jgi:hypothetical protein|tara:strand:- start:336 stop:845 length:510 start_codon:yes stop_codon:yes gene_type:complete
MIEVPITDSMLIEARKKAADMGELKGSMMKGDRNLTAFLGELAAQKVIGGTFHNTYDYDIMMESGKTVDVKTKKVRFAPRDYYDCTIFGYNDAQDCDYLLFTQVLSDLNTAYVVGGYDKKRFLEDSTFVKKGTVVGTNNLVYKKDNYVMQIKDLVPMDAFQKELQQPKQ